MNTLLLNSCIVSREKFSYNLAEYNMIERGYEMMSLMEMHKQTFGNVSKPIIGCLHMSALPGTPYYDAGLSMKDHIQRLKNDAKILMSLGYDAVVFANEGDRPYQPHVSPEIIATYVRIACEVIPELHTPYGCGVLIDPIATLAVANAIAASFVRTYVSNSYEGTFGHQQFIPADIFRYQKQIGAERVKVYTYFEAHAGVCLDTRSTEDQIASGFATMPISGMLVGGPRAGLAPDQAKFMAIRKAFPDKPLILGSGANIDNISALLPNCDGVIVGTTIKRDAYLYNEIDPKRAEAFIRAAKNT